MPQPKDRLAKWIQKQDPYICCLQEIHFTSRVTYTLKVRGWKKIFEEIVAENIPNTGKESLAQIQEAQRVPYKINPRRNTPRLILIKLNKIKDKEKIFESS